MERPTKLSGEQGKYIEYLEDKISKFSPKKLRVKSYLTYKKIIDDTTKLVLNGIEIDNPNEPGTKIHVDIISQSALTDKDEKAFERVQKFIDKLPEYTKQAEILEKNITEEEIIEEQEMLKGDMSVESFINYNNG